MSPNILKSDLKSPGFVPFGANLTQYMATSDIPALLSLSVSLCLHTPWSLSNTIYIEFINTFIYEPLDETLPEKDI